MLKRLLREHHRGHAVRALGMTGGADEPALLDQVERATRAFAAPIGLLSLIERDHQWIAASSGLELTCLPRNQGFCHHVLDRGAMLEVCDPLADARFASLPSVTGEPHIRYYLGAAVHAFDGIDLGALCIADVQPRAPATADQRAYLRSLARQVSTILDRRLRAAGGIRP